MEKIIALNMATRIESQYECGAPSVDRHFCTLRDGLTDVQRAIFDQVWRHYVQTGKPIPVRSLQHCIGKERIVDVLYGVNGSLIFESTEGTMRCLNLTLLGALLTDRGDALFDLFVRLLGAVREMYGTDCEVQHVSSDLINKELNLSDQETQSLLLKFLRLGLPGNAPIFLCGWGDDGSWIIQITDQVADLFLANSTSEYLEALLLAQYSPKEPWSERERLQRAFASSDLGPFESADSFEQFTPAGAAGTSGSFTTKRCSASQSLFVNPARLDDLRAVKNSTYDCTRLILMCSELSDCASRGNAHAVIMLLRAIIDHVPPIFGQKSFREVANSYPGPRSFKDAMTNLENFSRKIADLYLHSQIRQSEPLPNMTQVNFSQALDLLLAEVVVLLSSKR